METNVNLIHVKRIVVSLKQVNVFHWTQTKYLARMFLVAQIQAIFFVNVKKTILALNVRNWLTFNC